jgi:hypothetical protein
MITNIHEGYIELVELGRQDREIDEVISLVDGIERDALIGGLIR